MVKTVLFHVIML